MSHSITDAGEYWLGTTDFEQRRLVEQNEFLRPSSAALFDQIGVTAGWRVLDLACGPIGVLDLLAERADSVTGLDQAARYLAEAEQALRERGLTGVEFVQADAVATGLPAESYDFVHGRLLLINIPQVRETIAEAVRLTRPGGRVAFQEPELMSWHCEPAHPDWDRVSAAFAETFSWEFSVGPRAHELLSAAGLVDVKSEALDLELPAGHLLRELLPYFVELRREEIIGLGRLTAGELDASLNRLREHAAEPGTRFFFPRLYQVWGRKP